MALLNKDEQRQVAEAIDRVEQRTDAELVTVLAARADDYAYMPLIWAGLIGLLLPGTINYCLQWLSADELMLAQMSTFIIVALVCHLSKVSALLVPLSVRRWRAGNLARRQFLEQNLHKTHDGTGILVFISEAERYVEILVDHGIASRLHDDTGKRWSTCSLNRFETGRFCRDFWGVFTPAASCLPITFR